MMMRSVFCLVVLPALLLGLAGNAAAAAQRSLALGATAQADVQEILSLLAPVNLRQLDRLSKPLFDDFFTQKDRIYRNEVLRLPLAEPARRHLPTARPAVRSRSF